MVDLQSIQRIHVIGAAGAGMSALAKVLSQMGYAVTGSDLKFGELLHDLEDLGLEVWEGSRPEQMATAELIVASSAVPDRDPEVEAARQAGIPVWRRPQLLEALTALIPTIGATGTHGKTTTTAMLVTALGATGLSPSFVVGGELRAMGTNGALRDRDLFVLEVDEAFGTFLGLSLRGLVVTNVEPDHLDFYRTPERLEHAFAEVMERVSGPVLAGIDDPGGRQVADRTGATTYGTSPDADWRITDARSTADRVSFDLRGREQIRVEVPKPGLHVARNAAGALALIAELGIDLEAAAEGLSSFAGVRRRFEERGTIAGITIIDDYAHHPSEVRATLEAARHGDHKRIWAVFQPHRYSRTAELAGALGEALAGADRIVVTDVYAAGEQPLPGITGARVAEAAEAVAPAVAYVPHRAELAGYLARELEPGDLVLCLGAGDISLLPEELARALAS